MWVGHIDHNRTELRIQVLDFLSSPGSVTPVLLNIFSTHMCPMEGGVWEISPKGMTTSTGTTLEPWAYLQNECK